MCFVLQAVCFGQQAVCYGLQAVRIGLQTVCVAAVFPTKLDAFIRDVFFHLALTVAVDDRVCPAFVVDVCAGCGHTIYERWVVIVRQQELVIVHEVRDLSCFHRATDICDQLLFQRIHVEVLPVVLNLGAQDANRSALERDTDTIVRPTSNTLVMVHERPSIYAAGKDILPRARQESTWPYVPSSRCRLFLEVAIIVVVRSVPVRVVHLDGRCKSPADPQHHVAEPMHQPVDLLVEVRRKPIEDNDNNKA